MNEYAAIRKGLSYLKRHHLSSSEVADASLDIRPSSAFRTNITYYISRRLQWMRSFPLWTSDNFCDGQIEKHTSLKDQLQREYVLQFDIFTDIYVSTVISEGICYWYTWTIRSIVSS